MGWIIVIGVVLGIALVVRRLGRGRSVPRLDQHRLENASYSRIGQDVHNADVRYGRM